MLEWLTFVAAAVAALGSVVGPIAAYRSVMSRIAADRQTAATGQQQATVDRYLEQAVGTNPVAASFAVAQLDYLLSTGDLTPEQTSAAYHAIEASLAGLRPEIEQSGVDPEEENGPDAVDRGGSTT